MLFEEIALKVQYYTVILLQRCKNRANTLSNSHTIISKELRVLHQAEVSTLKERQCNPKGVFHLTESFLGS